MSHQSHAGLVLLVALAFAGCQTSGRMTRQPSAVPEAQAQNRNRPNPSTPSAALAQGPKAPASPQRPATSDPMAAGNAGAKRPELVIRATSPSTGDQPPPPESRIAIDAKPTDGLEKVKQLIDHAAAKNSSTRDYVARFRRREVVNGKAMPEDVLLFRHLKDPNSVYFRWLPGTKHEGRELIFVEGQYGNQIQVRSGKGDLLSGVRTEVDPRSERATANSRRTIDEAGLDYSLRRLGAVLDAQSSGRTENGTLQYAGSRQRPESRQPMECVVQQVPPGREKHLPRGGTRYWYFCTDPLVEEVGLPTLIITHDEARREVEYYHFDRFNLNIGLRPQDFDPNGLWGKR